MATKPDAKVIILRQTRVGASDLNRYAVQQMAMGCVVNPGDQFTAYQVATTFPDGPVVVTDSTKFVFAG